MAEWKSIDSAPKDGTLVIVWAEDFDYPVLAQWSTEAHHLHQRYFWGTGNRAHWLDLYAAQPTHWQPLPEPPK